MATKTRYNIMPDFGGAYGWIMRDPDERPESLGPNHACSSGGWAGDHPISAGLEDDFAQWQRVFEHGVVGYDHFFIPFDWVAFNQRGLELTRRLKLELGNDIDVVYHKATEDPNWRLGGILRANMDGTFVGVPSAAIERSFGRDIPAWFPRKIVSGGQTGVDRGALDFAIYHAIPHGGWCPKGRKASDGVIPVYYQLVETESSGYRERTRRNVQDSDATLVINSGILEGGTALTVDFARKLVKPCLLIQLDQATEQENATTISEWMKTHRLQTLNVAGPREEKRPPIVSQTQSLLMAVGRIGLPDSFKPRKNITVDDLFK